MVKTSRLFVTGTLLLAAGFCGAGTEAPSYFRYFGAPVRPDRFTRNMHALIASRVVDEPALNGGRSLEMEFVFQKTKPMGQLVWDIPVMRISRIRFSVYNPNPEAQVIRLYPVLLDTAHRSWNLVKDGIVLKSGEWTTVDLKLADAAEVTKGNATVKPSAVKDPVFFVMFLKFDAGGDFKESSRPLKLYLDGMECY